MKPPSNVKTPAQYIASLPADRARTIATVRALVNKHIPRGYDECLVWGTIGWTIPLSRYPDTYNKQPICYVALSSQKNYCSLYLMGAFWSASQLEQLKAAFKAAGKKLDMGKCCVHFESPDDLPLEGIAKLISAISSVLWFTHAPFFYFRSHNIDREPRADGRFHEFLTPKRHRLCSTPRELSGGYSDDRAQASNVFGARTCVRHRSSLFRSVFPCSLVLHKCGSCGEERGFFGTENPCVAGSIPALPIQTK